MDSNRAELIKILDNTKFNKIQKTLSQQNQNLIKYTDDSYNIQRRLQTNLVDRETDLRTNDQIEKIVVNRFLLLNLTILESKYIRKRPYSYLDILTFFINQNEQYCINDIENQWRSFQTRIDVFKGFLSKYQKVFIKYKLFWRMDLQLEQNKNFFQINMKLNTILILIMATNPKISYIVGLRIRKFRDVNKLPKYKNLILKRNSKGVYEIKVNNINKDSEISQSKARFDILIRIVSNLHFEFESGVTLYRFFNFEDVQNLK